MCRKSCSFFIMESKSPRIARTRENESPTATSAGTPDKVSQPDSGVKDVAHEVALNSYQKVVKANGECAIIEHVEVTGGNYAQFVESQKSHDIEKCATSLDAGIQELGRAKEFGGL